MNTNKDTEYQITEEFLKSATADQLRAAADYHNHSAALLEYGSLCERVKATTLDVIATGREQGKEIEGIPALLLKIEKMTAA